MFQHPRQFLCRDWLGVQDPPASPPLENHRGTPRRSPELRFTTSSSWSWACAMHLCAPTSLWSRPTPSPSLAYHPPRAILSVWKFGLHSWNPAKHCHLLIVIIALACSLLKKKEKKEKKNSNTSTSHLYGNALQYSPQLWCIDLCYHYDNSHSHLTPHYTFENCLGLGCRQISTASFYCTAAHAKFTSPPYKSSKNDKNKFKRCF